MRRLRTLVLFFKSDHRYVVRPSFMRTQQFPTIKNEVNESWCLMVLLSSAKNINRFARHVPVQRRKIRDHI